MNQPVLHLVAGPNGAGKTTFARRFLPEFANCDEFLNADLIAAGLSPFAVERTAPLAGRILLQRMETLVANRATFGLESTLAGRTYASRFARMCSAGYRIQATFLWLPQVDIARIRVANRVRQGGHHVPDEDIDRRYRAGLENLFSIYLPLFDRLELRDGREERPPLIALWTTGLNAWQPIRYADFERIRSAAKSRSSS